MKTENTSELVALLEQLLTETEKMNIGKIYIAIIEAMKRITFVAVPNSSFSDVIYKHLIQLAIKDFIHSGRSEASAMVVKDVIGVVTSASIVVNQ